MRDDDLPGLAAARILMIETPADKVQLPPPPPSRVDESAMLWRPLDEVDNDNRVALAPPDDGAASAAGVWMGMTMLHAVMVDARPELVKEEPRKNRKDEEEPRDA
ncbi:MAG: hypothetical protein K1X57_09635 [Gemmataceae bacterium]|nr:hypothetical protein [Gemmataceae bacterium]